jgi:transcriptional regulator with XRE-family HTH domain
MTELSEPIGLGPLLLRARRSRPCSQQRLAEQLCAVAGMTTVSRHEISRWEREDRIPSSYWLAWLGVVLDLPVAELERAAAATRERRGTVALREAGRAIVPASWPWRLIVAYAVAGPDGSIALQARPPLDQRSRPPDDRRHRLRSSREPNSDGPG